MMADNLAWLVKVLYPNQKIIIWAHNTHIARSPGNSDEMMGEQLPQSIVNQSYVMGLFYYSKILKGKDVINHMSSSLESRLHDTGYSKLYLDLKNQKESTDNHWLFNRISSDTPSMSGAIFPEKQYDGILFFNSVNGQTLIH